MRLSSVLMAGLLLALSAIPARAAGLRDVVRALETPFQAATPAEQRIQDYTADFFQESRIASLDRQQRARGRVSVRFDYRRGGQVPTVMFNWQYNEPTTQEIVSDGKTLWVYLPENNQVIQSDIEMVSKSRENDPMTFLTGLGNLSRDFQISYAEPNRDIDGNYVLDLRPRRTTALLNRMVIVIDRAVIDDQAASAETQRSTPSDMEPPVRPSRGSETRRPASAMNEPAARGSNSFFDDDFNPNLPISETPAAPSRGRAAFDEPPRPRSFSGNRPQRGGLIFPILSTTVYDPNGNSTTIEFSDLRVNRGLSTGEFSFIPPPGVEVVRPTGKEMGF